MPKNILMICIDDLNAIDSFKSFYNGEHELTPNLDSLMSRGTTFDNAFCQTALCNPSRASVLSGKSPIDLGQYQGEGLLGDFPESETLHGVLKASGYYTASAGKVYHQEYKSNVMFDETYYGEHNNVANDPFKVGIFGGNLENMGDYKNTSWAIDILDKFSGPGDDPLFLSVGLTAPHVDWVAPQEYFDRFPLDTIVLPEIIENDISDLPSFARLFLDSAFQQSVLDADAWARIIQGYLATVSFTDDMIGRLLQGLTESGLEENTSIVLWSDHGQHFGEKEKWNKFTLWEEAARSPLVIVDPDIGTPGQHVEDVVEFLDIFPTILDLVGAAPVSWTQGRSLVPLMEGDETPWNGVAFSNIYGSFSVRTGDYRYSRYEDGSEELYDIRHDPHEWVNLAGDPSYAVVKSELSADLNQYFQGHSIFVSGQDTNELVGTDENDTFVGGHETTMAGGLGDDTYLISHAGASVVENSSGGHDRVVTYVDFKLPENVEDLWAEAYIKGTGTKFSGNTLSNVIVGSLGNDDIDGDGGNDYIRGRSGKDKISGGSGNDVLRGEQGNDKLDGGSGDDLLVGGDGADTFVFSGADGNDTITDFGAGDRIDLTAYAVDDIGDFDIAQVGANTVVSNYGGGAITLDDTTAATLDGGDFIFSSVAAPIVGTTGADSLEGTDGDDTLLGLGGNDTLNGLGGNDSLEGGADDDVLRGQDGNDTLLGDDGDDVLVGNDGDDTLMGGDGVDILYGDAGDDSLDGGAGNDRLEGGEGADFINGGDGDDTVEAGAGADTLNGGAGNDILNARGDDDWVDGGEGDDTVRGHGGDDTLSGGVGNDQVVGEDGNDTMVGEAGDDTLWGGNDADTLSGGIGNDRVNGGAGDDVVDGDAGNDSVFGLDGADTLDGGVGNDVLGGGSGNDILDGGEGDDFLFGVEGDDTLDGGVGNDRLDGADGDDEMSAGDGDDTLEGGSGNDVMDGGTGDDILNARSGDDDLNGGAGADVLRGHEGADSLDGGAGNDTLVGGDDADRFVFAGANGADRIVDFQDGIDRIDLTAYAGNGVHDVGDFTIAQVGVNTVISNYGGGTITLSNTDAGDIDDADFMFG